MHQLQWLLHMLPAHNTLLFLFRRGRTQIVIEGECPGARGRRNYRLTVRVVVPDDLIMGEEIKIGFSQGLMQQLEAHTVQRWSLIRLPIARIAHWHGLLDVFQTVHATVIPIGVPAQIHLTIAIKR